MDRNKFRIEIDFAEGGGMCFTMTMPLTMSEALDYYREEHPRAKRISIARADFNPNLEN